ncbi:MAG: DUF883 family protein [Bradyrhizobiaceae bacterium]|nr:DUF883 family protein [Bradyrhizobiaceae bacterium]
MAEAQKATSSGNGGRLTSPEIDREIAALKDEMSEINKHLSRLFSATGRHAVRSARQQYGRAREAADEALSEASQLGSEAADAIVEARDSVADAVEESVQQRPFTTLALALGIGFVAGAMWRR